MILQALVIGLTEQNPNTWWQESVNSILKLYASITFKGAYIAVIGISYQMLGLVALGKAGKSVLPSILCCDGRAFQIGNHEFLKVCEKFCFAHYLNSQGNFTASKLKWIKDHEPCLFASIDKIMLPVDYIAYLFTGFMGTTISGISEVILWENTRRDIAFELLDYYDIEADNLPPILPQFGVHNSVTEPAVEHLA
jgi:xylulokinase